ncbi:uncharacterized protein LOC126700356 [Quercus robur]|uniref:uncharacterized protein LOC126700356 n=1 Tax=Quercus robur TaxID=38942 RepID=UPI00216211D0|nr:uncharacterized protein LOC126700356 [Quercus robur]
MGKDFFLIRFSNSDDYDKVLRRGSWFVGEHFLAIRLWEPYFKASEAKLSSVAMWVRLPELPIELYDASMLREIGSAIGPMLRIDSYTTFESRGSYARLCIQIDIDKPLIKSIWVGRLIQQVLYEDISSLCFCCGRLGHKQDNCPYRVKHATKEGDESNSLTPNEATQPVQSDPNYGPWMVVTRKKNTNTPGRPHGPTHLSQTLATGLKGNLDLPEANTSKGMEKNLNKSNPRDLVTSSAEEIRVEAAQNTEDIMSILKYMMIWKPEWMGSKDFLRRMGWSMVEEAMMNSNPQEIEGALNADFKKRIFEMTINHHPSIMVVTKTRVGGDIATRIIEELPFDGCITTDTIGYVGGLWILWKKEDVKVLLLLAAEQEIHASIKVSSSNFTWLISTIYASPRLAKGRILWNNLKTVAHLHNLPWLMLGDFNEVLCGDDKFGGNTVNINKALEFKDCLDKCNMLDLGFVGPRYTWTNRRPISALILERIDRCFANPSWRTLYAEAAVTHLPRTFSAHCLVLLELCRPNTNNLGKLFQFQTMWLLHPGFPKVVQEAWLEDRELQIAISDFANRAKKWNVEVFGNLFARKRRVLARLNGSQKALANNPNDFLLALEEKLIEEYSLILIQEEEYWALKSRLNVATFGD